MLLSRSCLFIPVLFFCAAPASAYIDPGAGSYVVQVVIALLVSAGFAVKTFWQQIKNFFAGSADDAAHGKNK